MMTMIEGICTLNFKDCGDFQDVVARKVEWEIGHKENQS